MVVTRNFKCLGANQRGILRLRIMAIQELKHTKMEQIGPIIRFIRREHHELI